MFIKSNYVLFALILPAIYLTYFTVFGDFSVIKLTE